MPGTHTTPLPTPVPPSVSPRPYRAASTNRPLTTDLFRAIQTAERANDLVAVGLALHYFTEIVRELEPIAPVELHRATTILSKQTGRLLADHGSLDEIHALMTVNDRIATADGRTVEQFCGAIWPTVRSLAAERCVSAIDGANSFGETAVLHLAATRAVQPRCVWWGTDGWAKRVDEWSASTRAGRRLVSMLKTAPEHVDDDVLSDVIDAQANPF